MGSPRGLDRGKHEDIDGTIDDWIDVNESGSTIEQPTAGDLHHLPALNNVHFPHYWRPLPVEYFNEQDWWITAQRELSMLQNMAALAAGSTTCTTTSTIRSDNLKSQERKRQRRESALSTSNPSPCADTSLLSSDVIFRAKTELSNCTCKDTNMVAAADLPCDSLNGFAMTAMGPKPLDYFGASLRTSHFEARVIEPFSGKDRREWCNMPGSDGELVRPPGKSLHMVFTRYPVLEPEFSLEYGFALLITCRRREGQRKWEPLCFVSFEDPASKKKLTGDQIGFVGNLDRCIGMTNGKRIWGQRTSHVRHCNDSAKPLRIAPKGSAKNFVAEDSFCIFISLHDPNGRLMRDVKGKTCIAKTNPFRYQEKNTDSSMKHLLEELDKLTLSQRASLAHSSPNREITLLVLVNAISTQEAAGLYTSATVEELPLTACSLKTFFPSQDSPITAEYKNRLRVAARYMGYLHANAELTGRYPTYLKCGNIGAANGRYMHLADTNLRQHQEWLASEGVTMDISALFDRSQTLGSIMSDRKYRSLWIACVVNVYPDSILVDKVNEQKVYCLAEEARESPLEVVDRLQPLARLAFTSKIPREDLQDVLLTPYQTGFELRYKGKEQAIDFEKFWLLLHAGHIDYFLYWCKFRNGPACRRIQARLLEEDASFDSSFFAPDRFKKLLV